MSQQSDEELIFNTARKIDDPLARAEYLSQACDGDDALLNRVKALLESQQAESQFLESPADAPTLEPDAGPEKLGAKIGRYKLLQEIGTGGFGVVYMAEQTQPVRRKVALKIIKAGMDTKEVVARFEAERQALAMMDHPNIAQVHDGGATETGRPYFVMELVKGVPITQFCDKNKYTPDQRLKLFLDICHAVQHAHQKGIIHRDLKPSNVLVTLADGKPIVKVIDFGIAKATNQQLTERTLFTAFGQMVGTPQYMSPEQAEMSCLDVDTRSDVYALGVLLYELLTGTTPVEAERLRSAGYAEMQRIIKEEEPPKPSNRLSTSGEQLTVIADRRRISPEKLMSQVRGDLDWIVMKTLEKDRNRRYESASGLAADVLNYLDDEPVEARPPTVRYRVSKYVRRNRVALTISCLFVGAMLVATAISSYFAFDAWQTREEQQRLISRLERTVDQLRTTLTDKAFNSIFTGELSDANDAIDDLTIVASTDLVSTLRGLALFVGGKHQEGLLHLEAGAVQRPTDVKAQSALSWAYHHTSQPAKHERTQERLRQVLTSTPGDETVYDKFFLSLEAFVDGSEQQLKSNLARLNEVISQKRKWGAAYALRAAVLTELGIEEKSIERFQLALQDFEEARRLIGSSPMLISTGIYLVTHAVELGNQKGLPTDEWLTLGQELSKLVDPVKSEQLAITRTAHFQGLFGTRELAEEFEEAAIERSESGRLARTAAETNYNRYELPIDSWRHDTSNLERQVCLALALIMQDPSTDDCEEAREIVRRLVESKPSSAFYVIAMDVASILGDADLGTEIIRGAQRMGALDRDHLNYSRMMKCYSREMKEDELLALAEPFSSRLSCIHYAIGMRALADRKTDEAKRHFAETVKQCQVKSFCYHNSKVFLRRLQDEGPWPKANLGDRD